jgi:hypothetical protein
MRSLPPALKHGAYSALAVLPGENQEDFEKLHQAVRADLAPSGPLENDIALRIAGLLWRKQNLRTLRIAEAAKSRCTKITEEKLRHHEEDMLFPFQDSIPETYKKDRRAADARIKRYERAADGQARKELGESYELSKIDAANVCGLDREIELGARIDRAIANCLKQLVLVRGVKSLAPVAVGESAKCITAQDVTYRAEQTERLYN